MSGNGFCPSACADIARQIAIAEPLGDLAVGQCRAGPDGARDIVDAAIEVRTPRSMSIADVAQLFRLAPQAMRQCPRWRAARPAAAQSPAPPESGGARGRGSQPARSSGSCTPATPRPLQTMPQQPIAVSNNAKAKITHAWRQYNAYGHGVPNSCMRQTSQLRTAPLAGRPSWRCAAASESAAPGRR